MSYCAVNYDRLVLRILRVGDPFVLHTDASGVAVGATLGQLDKDGVEHPLAFASHKLSGSQCNWSTIEREAYAIIWALDKFRDTVYGSNITVVCDRNTLQYIRDCAPKSAKLLRWSLALQEFVKIGHFRRKTRYNSKTVQDRRIVSIKVE